MFVVHITKQMNIMVSQQKIRIISSPEKKSPCLIKTRVTSIGPHKTATAHKYRPNVQRNPTGIGLLRHLRETNDMKE